MDEEVVEFLRVQQAEYEERTYFLTHSLGAENHWLFTQAYEAMTQGLYLPACTGFITGIEASIRNTMAQIKKPNRVENVDDVSTLSNGLLRVARTQGLPVECLIFPGEEHFEANLQTKTHVEIVRIRHNLCHGRLMVQYKRFRAYRPAQPASHRFYIASYIKYLYTSGGRPAVPGDRH